MSQLALKIDNQFSNVFVPQVIEGNKEAAEVTQTSRFDLIFFLGTALVILQILDGILTGSGMSLLGTEAEGNGLLRILMEQYGYVSALVITKLMAVGLIFFVCACAKKYSWIQYALGSLVFFYTFCAVIPWVLILSNFWC